MKGIIISIEGTDGAGKHTQQQLLMKDLKEQGYSVLDQSFPHYNSDSSAPVKMPTPATPKAPEEVTMEEVDINDIDDKF